MPPRRMAPKIKGTSNYLQKNISRFDFLNGSWNSSRCPNQSHYRPEKVFVNQKCHDQSWFDNQWFIFFLAEIYFLHFPLKVSKALEPIASIELTEHISLSSSNTKVPKNEGKKAIVCLEQQTCCSACTYGIDGKSWMSTSGRVQINFVLQVMFIKFSITLCATLCAMVVLQPVIASFFSIF